MKPAALLLSAALASPALAADPGREAFTQALPGLDEATSQSFLRGRSLFAQNWVVAPAKDSEVDGLGPLYNRLACISCHPKNGRGKAPEREGEKMQSMLVRLSVPGRSPHGGPLPHPAYGDQLNEEGIAGVRGEGRAAIRWIEREEKLADGTPVRLRRPRIVFSETAYGTLDDALTSPRVGPPVFGLGLLQAVPAATLRQMAREAKPDGVKGAVNQVWQVTAGKAAAGRFGLKANMPDLAQQIAGAMVGDLGITSPLFPAENCTRRQEACRIAVSGGSPELSAAQLQDLLTYLSLLAPPPRREGETEGQRQTVQRGQARFAAAGCTVCHRPTLETGDAPWPALARQTFHPYTDLLLHDMGEGLADGRPDYRASGRQWRTAPLWGLGRYAEINEHEQLLHDGRARNLNEAILWHGGEARNARERFRRLPREAREELFAFLRSL
ncbi:di-heme oxidoreductase family protein [Azospira sp. I09]|uniref:di-heme oxidoreductase family protein n=1 Tax=Azospira sp. I09 TaxID=1765049 RepID=UPI00126105D0|nr:di-heme oxidoredictase family protein [Azospira sp. I09]BBN89659.1 thiol oxidoreductase [Azospira sp. I09]